MSRSSAYSFCGQQKVYMQSADKPTQPEIDLPLLREKTQDEIRIKQSEHINALQRYRWNVVGKGSCHIDRAVELLRIEQDLQSTAQEEKYISKKPEITGSWLFYRSDVQAELQDLNKRYWLLERQWWKVRNSFMERPLIRAFDLWRSHSLWYIILYGICIEFCWRIVRRGKDAVAVAVDVAFIARLMRHDSSGLDIVRWNGDVVTKVKAFILPKEKRRNSLGVSCRE
ncbi:unnamed protein product [Penicillium egyptiacum]|uniref:Uncharacterized protein n=1 Tax=Penicillium egyptiacum TaxID=1303716 RepID=A0A9W4KBL9_9EURO|nr:unnamed protein product [Penicillium egyptiacum]